MKTERKLKIYMKLVGGRKQAAEDLGYTERQVMNWLNGANIPKVVGIALEKLISDKTENVSQ